MVIKTELIIGLNAQIAALDGSQTRIDLLKLKKSAVKHEIDVTPIDDQLSILDAGLSSADINTLTVAAEAALEGGSEGTGSVITPPQVFYDKFAVNTSNIATRLQGDSGTSHLNLPAGELAANTLSCSIQEGASLWSLNGTSIEPSSDRWQGAFFLDSINQLLYVYVTNRNQSPYVNTLAAINLDTGVPTIIGSFQNDNFNIPSSYRYVTMDRESEDSGNFIVMVGGYEYVIDSTDGSLISESPVLIGGTEVRKYDQMTGLVSPNGKYFLTGVSGSANYAGSSLMVNMGGNSKPISLPLPLELTTGISRSTVHFRVWGKYLLLSNGLLTSGSVYGARLFDKVDLFRYVDEYLGLVE